MNTRSPCLRHYLVFVVSGFVAVILGLIIFVPYSDLTWHDQQRLGQIAVFALTFTGVLLLRKTRVMLVSPVWLWLATGILAFGLVSASLALHPVWAASEVSLLVGSVGVGVFVFCVMREFSVSADLFLGAFLRLLLASMVLQFYVYFLSALTQGDLFFDPWSLLDGFSNVRFQGQFLTIVVPLLGGRLFLPQGTNISYPRWGDMFLMVSLIGMVFVAGTRGTIAAWLAVSVMFLCLKGGNRATATRMLLALLAGYVLAWFALHTVTWVTGQAVEYRFSGDRVFGLSARELLWEEAWTKIVEFPWLGIGPMHFASLKHPVANHPHQALLQIAAEWGLPVFFMVVAGVIVWLIKVFKAVKDSDLKLGSELRWALVFAVLASIVQCMVDGVLVMPYPQLWLAITVGWCSARCLPLVQSERKALPALLPMAILGAATILLIAVAVTSYPNIVGTGEYCGGAGGPRFWCNGRI